MGRDHQHHQVSPLECSIERVGRAQVGRELDAGQIFRILVLLVDLSDRVGLEPPQRGLKAVLRQHFAERRAP